MSNAAARVIVSALICVGSVRAAPPDFPRVTQPEQQSRDSDRKRILEDELKAERERLADATAKKDAGAIARHTADIASLEAELGKRAPVVLAAAPKVKQRDGLPDAFGGGMPDAFGAKVQD